MAHDARALALSVLEKVGRGKFAAPTLDLALERNPLERQERGLATDLVYGTLRRLRWLDASLVPRLRRPEGLPPWLRWLLRAGAYEALFTPRPRHAVVHAWVETAKKRSPRLAGLANAVLRRVELIEAPEPVRLGVPDFLWKEWRARFAPLDWVEALNEPAPLWLTLYPGGRELLEAQGIAYTPGPIPDAVRVEGRALREIEAFARGRAQPQNPASLFAAQLLDPPAGARVLDLAGGAGLKAAWLAARGAAVTSVDANARRQEEGRKNLRRLGLEVAFVRHDLTQPLELRAPYVLLDAPCLGTGTLRGHPELRMRLHPEDLPASAARQRRLLENAALAVEEGGVLVYAVCSLTQAEGEEQIARFVEAHPEFSAERFEAPLPVWSTGHGAYVRPTEGLDGFYYARLRKAYD